MTHESAKELDRHLVIRWLYEAFISPSRAFNEYTDDEIKELAHDALVLFNEEKKKDKKHQILLEQYDLALNLLQEQVEQIKLLEELLSKWNERNTDA